MKSLETPWPKFTKRPTPRKGAHGRNVQVRVIFLESVTYLPAPPARKRRQPARDGSHSAFWARRMRLSGLSRPRRVVSRPHGGRLSPALSAHLSFVDARGGCRVVLVVTPRRMMEMDDEIAVVRNDRLVEGDGSDAAANSATCGARGRTGRASPRHR